VQISSTPVALTNVPLPDIDHDQPTAQQIHAAMKAAIVSLALPPGTRLSEAETGARFGASRTPVREAMTWLRDEGLIVTHAVARAISSPSLSEDATSEARNSFVKHWRSPPSSGSARPASSPEDDARLSVADLGAAQRDLV
jgi:DNA-binding FadR family transcriptional regulator